LTSRTLAHLIIGVLPTGNLPNVPSSSWIWRHAKRDRRVSAREIRRLGETRFMSHDNLYCFAGTIFNFSSCKIVFSFTLNIKYYNVICNISFNNMW